MQAVKFAFDIARGMAFLHTLEPLIPRHHLNSRSVMVVAVMLGRLFYVLLWKEESNGAF